MKVTSFFWIKLTTRIFLRSRSGLDAVLTEKQSPLAALPSSSFNPQQFEEFFTESPPLSESSLDWAGPSDPVEPEVPIMPVVSPEPVATPPKIPPSMNTETVVIKDDDGSDPGIPTKESVADITDEIETAVVDPVDPEPTQTEFEDGERRSLYRLPSRPWQSAILSGNGIEPDRVLFPHVVFHFPSKEKKEAYDFMDKVVDKQHRLCDERQRLGLKRQTLKARIARMERKVRAMDNDPFQWEWRNFDCMANIPHMLRMYLRARGQVSGPLNALVEVIPYDSEEDDDEEEESNPWKRVKNEPKVDVKNETFTSIPEPAVKEPSMPDFSRVGMIDEDIPNVPDRGRSPLCNFRSQIRAPCALIKDLSSRDQEIAMAFIKALVA
ncbi:hypothetical protein AtNW77_Chr3g0194211 [Arabidopsis thaliana]